MKTILCFAITFVFCFMPTLTQATSCYEKEQVPISEFKIYKDEDGLKDIYSTSGEYITGNWAKASRAKSVSYWVKVKTPVTRTTEGRTQIADWTEGIITICYDQRTGKFDWWWVEKKEKHTEYERDPIGPRGGDRP